MTPDRQTLNLAAAVLCGIGSIASILAAKGGGSRSANLSGLLGTIGSVAWAASAYQDYVDSRSELEPT